MIKKYPLPKGWEYTSLGEICKFEYGSALPEHKRIIGSIPVFGSNGVIGYHNIAITQGPTIIIGRKGSIGQVNYSSNSCWPIDTTYYIDSSKTNYNLIWLFWMLKTLQLNRLNKATGVPGLNREDAYKQRLLLPPLSEQEQIGLKIQRLLQEIERARIACKKQLEAAKALTSVYLREVFESEEAKKWEKKKLNEVLEKIESGKRPKGGVLGVREGIPSLGAEHLNSFGKFNLDNMRYIPEEFYKVMKIGKIQNGDVLVVKDGATTGKVSFIGDDFPYDCSAINEHVFILRGKDSLDQEFLFWFLFSPLGQMQIKQEFHGAAQGGINQQFINRAYINLPPFSEQKHIVSTLKEKMGLIEKLCMAVKKQLDGINVFSQAILRKAFEGEL